MKLKSEDVILFYELYNRLDKSSPNIGIIGNKNKYDSITKEALREVSKDNSKWYKVVQNENRTVTSIFDMDNERTYVYIEDLHDLTGRKFRKYI